MSYQIVTGQSGLAGWRVLTRTAAAQRMIVGNEAGVKQQQNHARQKLAVTDSAEKLVGDYRLLKTALETYGLEADIASKSFLIKVLQSDTTDPKSLANRLSDKRYLAMAKDLGFGTPSPKAPDAAKIDALLSKHLSAVFEARVGDSDTTLRLAMNGKRELAALASAPGSDATKWYTVMGSTPLRKVVDGAFGFSAAYAKLPVERQVQEYQAAAAKMFGADGFAQLTDPAKLDKLIDRFVLRASLTTSTPTTSGYANAITLLRRG
ncbi:MAG: flagellar biosynthesis protein FlgF [Paracoccus denitrificans]|nr:MAG: flagellar biosynthesis protein FlgF [Paracoccus denitrificans]PZO86011.1 MAG: flagellar biosynthesis protein FlgF [Paracoccus denitrificans]